MNNVLYIKIERSLKFITVIKLNEKYKNSRSDGFTWHNKIGAKPLLSNYL